MSSSARGAGGPAELFANRELSFLEFNQRVVAEAADPDVPLLERLKFVSIVGANLDEFFMIRVAGLEQQLKSGVLETGPDGMLPSEQLAAIQARVSRQVADVERMTYDELLPALAREGVHLLEVSALGASARAQLARHFEEQLFGMLTPLAVDPGHPFPLLRNRSLNLAVHLLPEAAPDDALPLLAVVQVPSMVERFIDVEHEGEFAVVFVEDAIRHHVGALFPGMRLLECAPFRVLRNWDLSFDEDEQDDLLSAVQKELQRRWRLDAVRLEIDRSASDELVDRLRASLDLSPRGVERFRGPLAWADWSQVLDRVGRSRLRDEPFESVSPSVFAEQDTFAAIRQQDILLHHPYESYEPVLDMLERAANDPQVLAIKQTLYRVNRNSPLLASLTRAAENGKQVTALVELKARFDEEVNVEWARQLEEAGVHVVYGLLGLKTHCKVMLVVRREPDGIRRYVHLGTGNYNEHTAKIYSDLSFFTCREDVGRDISSLFNLLTGYSAPPQWEKLAVAPLGLRRRVVEEIDRARAAALGGREARIVMKTNALIDAETIHALIRAAQAGVEVVLLVRGPCTLRVGRPGWTDGITVRTIVDRFLEHSRVFHFRIDEEDDVFITSTDVMPRNFDWRIEVMLPVEDEVIKRRLIDEILATEMKDDVKASVLQPDGTHLRTRPQGQGFRAQAELMRLARERARGDGSGSRSRRRRGRSQVSEGRDRLPDV